MNKCLQCQKEYKSKRPSSKFCSDNCRVKYHRNTKSENKTKKSGVSKIELEVLYNKILDLVDKFENPNNPARSNEEYILPLINKTEEPPLDLSTPIIIREDYFISELKKCRDRKCVNRIMTEVEKSSLGWKIKLDLKNYASEILENFYDD